MKTSFDTTHPMWYTDEGISPRKDEKMKPQQVNTKALAVIENGKVALAIDGGIGRCTADCQDRRFDNSARTVTITLKFYPDPESNADAPLEKVKAQIFVKESIPERRTRFVNCGIRETRNSTPMLVWNDDSLDDVDQTTLMDKEDS